LFHADYREPYLTNLALIGLLRASRSKEKRIWKYYRNFFKIRCAASLWASAKFSVSALRFSGFDQLIDHESPFTITLPLTFHFSPLATARAVTLLAKPQVPPAERGIDGRD
jgi:hypothetical protein